MTNPTPRDSAQPLRDLTDDEKQLLHYNPNTSDLVEFVQAYAREALRAQAASPADMAVYQGIADGYQRDAQAASVEPVACTDERPCLPCYLDQGDCTTPPAHIPADAATIAGALFDFAGHLTTMPVSQKFGSCEEAGPMVTLLQDWAKKRGLFLDGADVANWSKCLAPQPQAVAASSPATAVDARMHQDIIKDWHDKAKSMGFDGVADALCALQASRQPVTQSKFGSPELQALIVQQAVAEGVGDDPLLGAAAWIIQALEGSKADHIAEIQSRLLIGYNRSARLHDAALGTKEQRS